VPACAGTLQEFPKEILVGVALHVRNFLYTEIGRYTDIAAN